MIDAVAEIEPLWVSAMRRGDMRSDFPLEALFAEAARKHRSEDTPRLRMSFGKDCQLEKWFIAHHPDKASPRGLSRMMHTDGNVFEAIAIGCLEYALEQTKHWRFDRNWMQRTLRMPGRKEEGHTDGAIFYDGQPYAIVDPKKTLSYAHKSWLPVPPRGPRGGAMKPSFGECRLPPERWGYRHQAGNYLRSADEDFVGFMWLVGMRDSKDLHIGWAERSEVIDYFGRSIEAFEAAERSTPPPPCLEDRGGTPCRHWISKSKGIYESYCDFLEPCLELAQNRTKYQV